MRLFNYLNESRTKSISELKAFDTMVSECRDIAKEFIGNVYIMRGSDTTEDYLHLKPGKEFRKSAHTSNYYTLFINNHPLWKNYPKRQIICSGGSGERAFNHFARSTYFVFPIDGSKIGICPDDDIWSSFNYQIRKYFNRSDVSNLIEFNEVLDYYGFSDDSWSELKKQLQNEEISIKNGKSMNAMKLLEEVLNPDKNGFKVETTSNFSLRPNDNLEVWLDSECILVHSYKGEILEELFRDEGL